jgi:hypothetical protein
MWSVPGLLHTVPKRFECVGTNVYIVSQVNECWHIDAAKRTHTKLIDEDANNFAGSGYDFTLTLRDKNVFAKGKNAHGQLGSGHFEPRDEEEFVGGISFPVSRLFRGGHSCFAVIERKSAFSVYLKELIDSSLSNEESKTMETIKCQGNTSVCIHKEMQMIHKVPSALNISREECILALKIAYGHFINASLLEWVHTQLLTSLTLEEAIELIKGLQNEVFGNPKT